MKPRVWMETGGASGTGEAFCDPDDMMVGGIDWDEFSDGAIDREEVIEMLGDFGDLMPQATRQDLLEWLNEQFAQLEDAIDTAKYELAEMGRRLNDASPSPDSEPDRGLGAEGPAEGPQATEPGPDADAQGEV